MLDLCMSPPPWSVHETPWEFQIRDAEGRTVAVTTDRFAAYVMAASPDLYKVCQSLLKEYGDCILGLGGDPNTNPLIIAAKDALDKATPY